MDKLDQMFELQKVLQKRLRGDELPQLMPDRLPLTVTSIVSEIGEILENVQAWKDWRKNPPPIDYNNLKEEIADLFHFAINLALYCGMDASTVYHEFVRKNEVNHARQDNSY